MPQNPFIEFKDDFTNSTPSYFIYEYTYKRLNYELQKCYTPVPMTAEPIIPYDELEERGIPYSREVSYQVKRECDDLFDEAMQELGLNQEQQLQTPQGQTLPLMAETPLQGEQQLPYLNGVVRETTQEAGKRRPRKSKKSKKSKRKSRKSKKSKKSRKYRKH
jgi:hypothetical protein